MTTLIPKFDLKNGGATPTGAINRPYYDKLAEIVSVKDFGAVGDGVTNDTAAIQAAIAAITANNGGTLYFPFGEYYIPRIASGAVTDYRSLFELSSNTYVEFQLGASISFNGVDSAANSIGLFGINWAELPVANIGFINCEFNQTKPLATSTNQIAAIQFAFAPDTANGSLQNVHINSCKFDYSGIYMVNRLSGSNTALFADRQTKNVIIDGCIATNNASQFVTADVNTCTISNCIVSGPIGDTTESYDGISIHSGFNINIIDNVFTQIHVGQVINVRDSVENGCGSKNINIIGNTIHDCTAPQAIQLATSGSPAANQGVFNVTIAANTIYGCVAGINITRAGTGALGQISITGNIITANDIGIASSQALANSVQDLLIANNDIHMISSGNYALYLEAITFGSVTGNNFISDNTTSSYQMTYVAGCVNLSMTGNTFFTTATNSAGVNKFGDTGKVNTNFSFIGNNVYSSANFSQFNDKCKVLDNNFVSNVTINGNVLGTQKVSYADGNVTWSNSAAPIAGDWVQGDITYNTNPTAGGYSGWICTTAGTPGTWKTFGAISA